MQKPSFTTKVASAFLFLALLTVATVGGVAFVRARAALKQAAFDRLSVTATLKQQEINRWLESCEQDFLLIAQFPDVNQRLLQLVTSSPGSPDRQTTYASLSDYMTRIRTFKPKFTEVFVIDRSNRIVLSTDSAREGKYEIATNFTYFEEVIAGEEFTPVFYVSPVTGKPAVTYASPIRDRSGQRQGVILANLNLKRIDQIVRERTGLGDSGETYVVGSLAEKTSFISREEISQLSLPTEPHSFGIDQAMQGLSGADLYTNYAGISVLGVYRWLNEQDIGLIVEMSQAEAFAPAKRLAGTIVVVGLGSAAVLLLGIVGLARQLAQSRSQLENYSRQLEQKAQEASAANRAKSEFLANMSHELRTPLNAILGFTQLMSRDRSLNSPQRDRLGIISRSGEHLLALINDVLSMSKIEAGRTTLDHTQFDLHQFLASLEEMLLIKAEAKGLQLYVHIEPSVPRYVEADEGKLRQILLNLLGNALKFTEQGKVQMTVAAQREPSEAEAATYTLSFTVQDTGPGIAQAEIHKLFDPFYQASRTRRSHQGTGLGLAITQRFIQLMGGDIQVQSQPQQGSVFSFTLLARAAPPMAESAVVDQPVIGLAPGQPTYRILIVDDAAESQRLLTELLRPVGFEVQAVGDGGAAVERWQSWQPHLIWMDMRMPGMDGYEATRQIRAAAQAAPAQAPPLPIIIALTASAFEEDRAAVLACGCNDFVRKPFRAETLFEKMAQHLGVQYRYAAPTAAAPAPTALQTKDLAVMPYPWLCRLHRAALQVDAERIFQLIEQIPERHQSLAQQIAALTHSFDFDTLVELTQGAL
ncbi:MAG: response regulator [Leptolyngbya sp. SIO4C1]|nr:response regulator [Leptolyngbya sp. SIO4C1]